VALVQPPNVEAHGQALLLTGQALLTGVAINAAVATGDVNLFRSRPGTRVDFR
jgi:hypothetical protein